MKREAERMKKGTERGKMKDEKKGDVERKVGKKNTKSLLGQTELQLILYRETRERNKGCVEVVVDGTKETNRA